MISYEFSVYLSVAWLVDSKHKKNGIGSALYWALMRRVHTKLTFSVSSILISD